MRGAEKNSHTLSSWHGYPIDALIRLVPFVDEEMSAISPASDFVGICELLNIGPPVDVAAEFQRFVAELGLKPLLTRRGPRALHANARAKFVAAAKYPFVLRYVLRRVIGEDLAFAAELPYLAETESDLLASFALITGGHGKQAVQLLRGVLEVAIAHGHFGLLGEDYEQLTLAADFRMPRFSGRGGMLNHLLSTDVVDDAFAEECRGLYSQLSLAVHSHIHHLSVGESMQDASVFWAQAAARVGTVLLRFIFMLIKKGV